MTATNAGGNASATSATVQIPATAPANTAPPLISGVPAVGQTLTCSQGSWSGTQPLTYAFQWLRDGKAINGASGPTHLVAQADAGNALTCRVTATNAAGAASATSSPVQIPKKR